MRLGMDLSYDGGFKETAGRLRDLEAAGLDVIWVPEAYSFDSVTQMGYLAATTERLQIASSILNVYGRSATTIAMTMAGLDYLSDGRAMCGLGASGPQVIEGFHGVPHAKPLTRVREYIEVCRAVWRREKVEFRGDVVSIPLPEGQGTGLGKALKLINRPVRDRIPIWWAALMDKSVAAAAEVADGWLPMIFMPERVQDAWGDALERGLARRPPELGRLEIAAGGPTAIGDDLPVEELRDGARARTALYVGGMGARGKNYYNTIAARCGFEAEAAAIQDLYLDGKKDEAAARVPAVMLEQMSLIGPRSYVAERIAAYKEAGVTVLNVEPVGGDPVRTVELMRELVD
jgi:F420-dependent oxidoreductase-like protein